MLSNSEELEINMTGCNLEVGAMPSASSRFSHARPGERSSQVEHRLVAYAEVRLPIHAGHAQEDTALRTTTMLETAT